MNIRYLMRSGYKPCKGSIFRLPLPRGDYTRSINFFGETGAGISQKNLVKKPESDCYIGFRQGVSITGRGSGRVMEMTCLEFARASTRADDRRDVERRIER